MSHRRPTTTTNSRPRPTGPVLARAGAALALVCALVASAPAAWATPEATPAPAPVPSPAGGAPVDLVPFSLEGDYQAQAAQLPEDLKQAVERDLGTTAEDYLARADAADVAVEVVRSLGDSGVDVLGSRLDGTRLVVNVDDEADAALVRSTGADAVVGEPETPDYATHRLQALADLVGGQGYVFSTLEGGTRYNNLCSIAFNGTSKSSGQRQFLTSGHCLQPNRQDGGVFFEARQSKAGAAFTRGPVIGTPLESSFRFGAGNDVGAVATASGWNPRPLVSTWGGGKGALTAGTPVAVTGSTPGIAGAPVCKSGSTTGWTCGDVLVVGYSTPVYNRSGVPVQVNTVLTSVCMLPGDSGSAAMVGNSALGIGTAGDWVGSCDRSSQPDAITAFFPLVTTDGKASVSSALPDWQLQTGSIYGNDWSPFGNFENATGGLKTTRLSGWAFDPDVTTPTDIHVYVGGPYGTGSWGGLYQASGNRPDVGRAFPGAGDKHGFTIDLPTKKGSTSYCLYAINTGLGSTLDLGCRSVSSPTGPPIGNVESATLSGRTATVSGWAIDPDVASSIPVHVYVAGRYYGVYQATAPRPDVARTFADYGEKHGFTVTGIPVPVGTTSICVYGINVAGAPENSQLGCRTVSTASGPPQGTLDVVKAVPGGISVAGWTVDPDTASPIDVHVYVDGGWGGLVTASASRPDVGRAFPGYGDNHGYTIDLGAAAGSHRVCAYAINSGSPAANTELGCRTVTVAGGNPQGNVESATVSKSTLTVSGWALDPDTADSIAVHVYIDGGGAGATTANRDRPDVARIFPGYGAKHGFQLSVPVSSTARTVCVYAINVKTGTDNPSLGCRPIR